MNEVTNVKNNLLEWSVERDVKTPSKEKIKQVCFKIDLGMKTLFQLFLIKSHLQADKLVSKSTSLGISTINYSLN
jgi:hypothetical protein